MVCTHRSGAQFEVLMVEDNPGDVDLTVISLRRAKLAVNLSVAYDGMQALEMLRREGEYVDTPRPDIILLDLNLPKLNGIDVLSIIKEDPKLKRIPVAIVTSSRAEEDIVRSYDLHANCYITKPLDLEQCRNIIEAIEDFWFTVVKLPRLGKDSYEASPQPNGYDVFAKN